MPEGPIKLQVKARIPTLTAVRLAADQAVQLADGRQLHARLGDWLISQGKIVVDLVPAPQLTARYTIEESGSRLLPPSICERIEQTTGIGSTRTPEDLVSAIERLARISIGSIVIDFTPGQLDEIHTRATKRGRTVKQELQAVVDRIREEIFWRS